MRQIASEWIIKAEGDFATAKRELSATDHPNYDAVCFHAQPYAEKYLKAFLQEIDIAFPKTHDLADLLAFVLSVEPTWTSMTADLNALSAFAVEYRYPGEVADLDEREKRFKNARTFATSSVSDCNCRKLLTVACTECNSVSKN